MTTQEMHRLCDRVREVAYAIHVYHANGHLEKVYQNAMVHRLRVAGLKVEPQHPISVLDEDGTPLGEYFADLLVEDELIVELKACRTLTAEHAAQVLGYLKGSRREHALLVSFGSFKFEIRKFVLSESSEPHRPPRLTRLLSLLF